MQECHEPEVLEELGRGLRVYATVLPRRLIVLLAARIVENVGGVTCIYTDDDKLAEAVEEVLRSQGLLDRAVLVKDATACRGLPTIFVSSRQKPPEGLDYVMLVSPHARGSRMGLQRLQATPLGGGVYRLRVGSATVLVREVEGRLCEPRDTLLHRVAGIVRDAVREYGPLPVRDAVQLLAQELGVSRSEARRLLYEAVSAGLLRIEAGSVTL